MNFFCYIEILWNNALSGVSGAPTDNNILLWNAVIFGPADTPFEDGTFKLTIEFTGTIFWPSGFYLSDQIFPESIRLITDKTLEITPLKVSLVNQSLH